MGRDVQERAKRQDRKKEERSLMALLEKSGGGSETGGIGSGFGGREALDAVRRAREVSQKGGGDMKQKNARKVKGKSAAGDGDVAENMMTGDEQKKKTYSAEMVKKLGFNPLLNSYGARHSLNNAEKNSALNKVRPSEPAWCSVDRG